MRWRVSEKDRGSRAVRRGSLGGSGVEGVARMLVTGAGRSERALVGREVEDGRSLVVVASLAGEVVQCLAPQHLSSDQVNFTDIAKCFTPRRDSRLDCCRKQCCRNEKDGECSTFNGGDDACSTAAEVAV